MAGNKLNIDPSEFQNLTQQIAEAISMGMKQGAQKGKKSFGGADLLSEMKDQLDEIGKAEKANAFSAQVKNKMLNEGISSQRAEIQLLSQQQIAKNNLVKTAAEQRMVELSLLKLQAEQAGNTDLVNMYDARIQKSQEFVDSIQRENNQIASTSKLLDKKLKQQEEEAQLNKDQEEVKAAYEEINKSLKARIGITDELLDQLRTPEMAKAAFAGAAIEKMSQVNETFEQFREMGLSAGQAVEGQFKAMSLNSMLGLSDTKGVLKGVVEEYGNINALSGETVDKLGTMAHHLGISGEEALKLNSSLSQMPGETSETAASAMEHTAHLAEAEGIAGSKVFNDMAKNSGAMALYGKGGAEAFGKSAIELHKMGVEIGTAAKMADGLLNFEDSINKQMEASVLLGKEINLDKARELALNGKLEGATKEVLKNVGSAAEFDKMNVLQKKALAEAAGMTVEELAKSIDAQEEHNKYFGEGAGIMANMTGYVMEYGGAAMGFLKENAMLLMAGLQLLGNENAMKFLGTVYDKIKLGLAMAYKGVLFLINTLMNSKLLANIRDFAIEQGKNALALVGLGIAQGRLLLENTLGQTKMGLWLKEKAQWAAEKAHMLWKKAQSALGMGGGAAGAAAGAASKGAEAMSGAAGAASKVPAGAGKSTGGLTKAIQKINPGKLLAGGAALIIVAAAVFVFAKAAQEFMSVSWEAIGMAIVAMLALVGALALIGAIMMSGVGALAILAGAAAMLIMAAALFVLGLAIQEIAKGFALFVPTLVELAPMALDLIVLGASLAVLGYGMITLGVASLVAAPGILLGGAALVVLGAGLMLVGAAGMLVMPQVETLMALASMAPMFWELAAAFSAMGAGLIAFATAGLFTLPTIAGLIALSLVAPILIALGESINFDLGGGSSVESEQSDKMDMIVERLDRLIAVASTGGEVKMDGKKVGEVVRLAMNRSNVR